jgi:hypothetical protein
MPYERLPGSVQTLYAELFEQAVHGAAETAASGAPRGSFVSKTIKGSTYWYQQTTAGAHRRQQYLGRESPSLLAWMEEARQARERSSTDAAGRARLVTMLAAGGATRENAEVVRVLDLLARAGVFRLGGVLVGTQAFRAYGNVLGVRFDQQSLRTEDVDIAQDPAIGVALAGETSPLDLAASLRDSGLGFFPVPGLDPRQPSTSFKIRGRELRVDFLTPLHGAEKGQPVYLPAFGLSASPLRFLGYLIEASVEAVVVGGSGILVHLPDPARFAFHKLWISVRRPVSEQTKAAKDLRQAGDLLDLLLADRPGDVQAAWESLIPHVSAAKVVRAALGRLPAEIRSRLAEALQGDDR